MCILLVLGGDPSVTAAEGQASAASKRLKRLLCTLYKHIML